MLSTAGGVRYIPFAGRSWQLLAFFRFLLFVISHYVALEFP
jgi:hypothetical protein